MEHPQRERVNVRQVCWRLRLDGRPSEFCRAQWNEGDVFSMVRRVAFGRTASFAIDVSSRRS